VIFLKEISEFFVGDAKYFGRAAFDMIFKILWGKG